MRPHFERNGEHLRRHCHLEIERGERRSSESRDVVVLDVTTVFAEMSGDVVGTCLHGELCRAQWVGQAPSPRIAQRGDVVDVDAKPDRGHVLELPSLHRGNRGHRVPSASPLDLSPSSRRRRCL
jgi:hypothetical protein